MKYSVEIHDLVYPKYAKVVFKINQAGNITLSASPSFTPGKLPAGMVGNTPPKGSRMFDYDKEIVISLGFKDCLDIVNFNNKRDVTKQVDIFRKSYDWSKKVTFVYTPDDNDPLKPKMVTIFFDLTKADGVTKFYLPLSFASFNEIASLLESYTLTFPIIKLTCGLEEQRYPEEYVKKSSYNNEQGERKVFKKKPVEQPTAAPVFDTESLY